MLDANSIVTLLQQATGQDWKNDGLDSYNHHSHHFFNLESLPAYGIKISNYYDKPQYKIGGIFNNLTISCEYWSINVSKSKSDEKIVQDIVKRFLPWYEQIFFPAYSEHLRWEAIYTQWGNTLTKVATILGDKPNFKHGQESYRSYHYNVNEVRCLGDDKLQLELSLSIDKALEILAKL